MKAIQINSAVWKKGDCFVAKCANIGVSGVGNTKEDALSNLQQILKSYFEENEHAEISVVEKEEMIGAN